MAGNAADHAEAVSPAAVAAALGLKDYQLELLHQLAEQAERQGIPREVLPVLAKYIERIDWDPILVTVAEAKEILGLGDRQTREQVTKRPEWMTPFIGVRGPEGKVVVQAWLEAKVRAFARVR